MESLLERYQQGHREAVWTQLLSAGSGVREEPLFSDAQAVLREAMNRVKRNLEKIIVHLENIGYRFGQYPEEDAKPFNNFEGPLVQPPADTLERIKAFETEYGPLPLSLRAFWEVVGSVNFVGFHPDWPGESDPLWVDPITVLEINVEEWLERIEYAGKEQAGPLEIWVAPDSLHKDNISGGAPYTLEVPNPNLDGILMGESHEFNFLDYLRLSFQWIGFPGWNLSPAIQLSDELQHLSDSLELI